MFLDQSTIAAIATPAGVGGIAVIRVSGSEALFVVSKIASVSIENLQPNSAKFGKIINPKTDEIIDEVILTVFVAPHSFTGENVVEIACHGSLFIQQQILTILLENGCRLANPGEFTQRAFLNGKLDLSQAEAVADLISASSQASHRLALSQMRGGFSGELRGLRASLLDFVSLIELELDFSEEDVTFADRTNLSNLANDIEAKISKLANSFQLGNAIKEGVPVAIVGETNAGKSTLLNTLINEDRAIVSDIHGTTRDTIEAVFVIKGIQFRLIDTAGLRTTDDVIEQLGIKRTFDKIEDASIILHIIDATDINEQSYQQMVASRPFAVQPHQQLITIINKIDKGSLDFKVDENTILISAKSKTNIDTLEKAIFAAANIDSINAGDIVVTNIRHYEALVAAQNSIERVINGLQTQIPTDFLAQDIREVMYHLGTITGEVSADDILGNIFARFCIGK